LLPLIGGPGASAMPDLFGVVLSILLPWLAGFLWVAALQRRASERNGFLSAGYGYPIGALATTLVMRAVSLLTPPWNLALVALPLVLLAIGGYWLAHPIAAWSVAWTRGRDAYRTAPASLRILLWIGTTLITVRLAGLAMEDFLRPLLPWDAWSQWATKSLVWYHYGWMAPFVSPAQWLAADDPMHFVDMHSNYPATVPLLQVWTALCLGHWDESLVNAPWPAMACALALAFYAQVRRLGTGPATAVLCTYLLLSLPFLDLHVALAGCADLFMAVAYGLAAMALWQWTLTRQRADAVLAAIMAVGCIGLKTEGILWALTLVPPVIVAVNRRVGFWAIGLLGCTASLYLLFGPAEVFVFGYKLRTTFSNVSQPLLEHLFLMDNWHLLWYATVAMLAANYRNLLTAELAPMSVTMLGAFAFVFVVFFYSSAAGGVDDESLVNRLLLHLVPAQAFYLVLLWCKRPRRAPTDAGATSHSAPSVA
jgi:hypothetical protein